MPVAFIRDSKAVILSYSCKLSKPHRSNLSKLPCTLQCLEPFIMVENFKFCHHGCLQNLNLVRLVLLPCVLVASRICVLKSF